MFGSLFCCRKRKRHSISLLPRQNARQDFKCSICMEPTVGAVMTSCGHIFCEECISEHFMSRSVKRIQDCPECRERVQNNPLYRCVQLDGIIETAVPQEEMSLWRERVRKHEGWSASRHLTKVEVGMELDVLDTEGVWCPAVVRLVIYSGDRYPLVKIHFLGWSTRFDEVIPANSTRLGPKGFYTSRARRKYILREGEDNTSARIVSDSS